MAEKNGNYQIVLSTRLDTTKIKSDLKKLEDFKLNVSVNMTQKSLDKLKELNKLLTETRALNSFTSGLVNIQKTMQSYEKVASKTLTATKNLSDGLQSVGTKSLKAAGHVKTFGDKVSEAFSKFSLWSVVSAVFYKVVRSIEGLVNTVVELDRSFTELTKVTNLTVDDFDMLTQKAYKLGSEVAKTTSEVIDAMTEFAKAGYSIEESSEILAKNALIWTNISDGTISAADSANMIISVMKAFNMEAEETTHIIDALNEVSNNYAISSGDLSDSLAKSSAVLANAGVTFEEQLGLITAGTEILRNANTVSTGLRTISLRLQGMEEDGTKVSGLTAKLESNFNNLGLTLYDTNGNLKDTFEILADLAKVFPNLNTEQKAYYTELIAGKTRAQVAAAVLNNFDRAIAATGTALDSAGSAARENAKVLDSLNGHIKAFKSEWESLVNSKSTQDTLKLFIDLGTLILKLIKNIGGLKTALIQIASVWALIKMANWGKTFEDITLKVSKLSGTLLKTKTAFSLAGGGIKGFSAALGSSKVALAGATLGISLLISAFGFLINKIKEAKQKHDEWIQSLIDSADETKKNIIYLTNNSDRYKELVNKIERTEEEENELKTIETEFISILGEKAEALSRLEEGTDEYRKAVEKLTEAEISNLTAKLYSTKNAAEEKLSGSVVNPRVTSEANVGDWNKILNGKDPAYDYLLEKNMATEKVSRDTLKIAGAARARYLASQGEITRVQYAIESYKAYSDALEELNKRITTLNKLGVREEADAISKSKTYEDITKRVNDLKDGYDAWISSEISILELSEAGDNYLIDKQEEYDSLTNSIKNNSDYTEIQKEILLEMVSSLYPDFSNAINDLKDSEDSETESKKGLINEYSDEIEKLKEIEDAYSVLSSAIKEYEENGSISAATLQKLIMEYPQYIQYLVDENGNIRLNKDAINELVSARKEEIKASIIQDALNRIDNLKRETEEEKALAQQIEKTTEEIKKNNQARFEALALLPAEDLGEDAEKIKGILNEAAEKIALLNKLFIGGSSSGSRKSKTTDAWKEAFTKAYNELKNRRDKDLIETAEYIDELEKLNEKYFKDRVGYEEDFSKYELEVYKERKNLLNEYIDDLEHEFKMLENQGASEEVLIVKYKEIQDELHRQAEYYRSLHIDENNDLIQKLKEQWWKYQKDIEKLQKQISDNIKEELDNQLDATKKKFADLRDVALDAIEKQIDEKNDWLEEQNKMIDDQIDKLKEETDNMENQKDIQDKLLKIEEARKKLAEAKNKKVRVYREGRGFVYEQDFDAVSSAQQELDNLLEDWNLFQEKARIDDIISGLEKEKDANKERVNQEISDLNRLKDAWDKSLDLEQDVENYLGWLERIKNSENKNFDERLAAVKTFAESYRNEMALLKEQYELNGLEFKEGNPYATNSGYGYKSYNGVDYNPNTDYQDLINKAVASGAPQDHLAYLEKQRNAKIMGEGITAYSPTYKYTTKESSTPSYSPSAASYVSSSLDSGSSSSWKPEAATDVGAAASSTKSSSKKSSSSSSSKSSGSVIVDVAKSAVNTAVNFFKKITGLADGTVDADGLPHFVGEDGPEFYVPPRGSSIIPNNLTSNLMAWGSISPSNLVASFSGGGGTSIEIGNISLPNVTDGESFVEELKNFKNIAIQSQTVRK